MELHSLLICQKKEQFPSKFTVRRATMQRRQRPPSLHPHLQVRIPRQDLCLAT